MKKLMPPMKKLVSQRKGCTAILIALLLLLPNSCNQLGVKVDVHVNCAHVIAEAAFALGTAALLDAAAAAVGLELAGFIVEPEILGYLAGVAQSLAALEEIAAKYLCPAQHG